MTGDKAGSGGTEGGSEDLKFGFGTVDADCRADDGRGLRVSEGRERMERR